MIKKIFLSLLPLFLLSSTLIDSSVYKRDYKVDLMLSLDKSFNGSITKINKNLKTYILITGIKANKTYSYQFKKNFLKKINIFPQNNRIFIEIVPQNKNIKILKTKNGFGIKIHIPNPKNYTPTPSSTKAKNLSFSKTPKIGENRQDLNNKLILVVLFSISLIVLGYLIKIYIQRKNLFLKAGINKDLDTKIIYQKPIDPKNRMVLIEFDNKHHLILLSQHGNILIDTVFAKLDQEEKKDDNFKFDMNKFEDILKKKGMDLEKYLGNGKQQK